MREGGTDRSHRPRGKRAERVVVVVGGQAELFEVVGAGHAAGGLASRLHRRQQDSNQDANDGDDDQQLESVKPRRWFARM